MHARSFSGVVGSMVGLAAGCTALTGLDGLRFEPAMSGAGGGAGCLIEPADVFDGWDDTLWQEWTNGNGASATVDGGALALTLLADPALRQAGINLRPSFDLTDCALLIEVAEHHPADGVSYSVSVIAPDGAEARLRVQGASLYADLDAAGGGPASHEEVELDRQAHRWWRFRHAGECLSWEVSPDGTHWSSIRTDCSVSSWSGAHLIMQLLAFSNPGAQEVRFDNFNAPP